MQRLVELRNKMRLTQSTLADYLGVARNSYSRYETGEREPDFDTLRKLASYFGTTISYLLGETDDPTPLSTKKEPPSITEALEGAGVTNEKHVNTIRELVDLMSKVENNAELADEITLNGLIENRRA